MTSALTAPTMTPPRQSNTAPAELAHAGSPAASARPLLGTQLQRGARPGGAEPHALPGWIERLLAIPLPAKLVGANFVLLAAGVAASSSGP